MKRLMMVAALAMLRLLIVLIFSAALTRTASAQEETRLVGKFSITGTFVCAYASSFIGTGVPSPPATATGATYAASGLMSFDGAGSASGQITLFGTQGDTSPDAQTLTMPMPGDPAPITGYSVAADNSVMVIIPILSARHTWGSFTGQGYTIFGLSLTGWLTPDHRTLTLSIIASPNPDNNASEIETTSGQSYQSCGISLTLVKVSKSP